LDEMDLTQMETGWGDVRINKTVDGNPLQIAGNTYDRGLGTHAIYKYMLDFGGSGRRFIAKVGVDDESGSQASVEFVVLGDKEILWQSGLMKSGMDPQEIDLDIKGINKLALLVTDGGDNINYDHVDWIDARFEYVRHAPEAVSPSHGEPYILTPPVGDEPRINGARVVGANPGHPFIYRVPVTGKGEISISLSGLPAGLSFDAKKHVITGTAPDAGGYPVGIIAENDFGKDEKTLTIKTDSGLALTPPLGWNSWNCWGLSVNQDRVKAAADAMVNSGLADHGWTNINIDDGWEADKRTSTGELLANEKFPDMKELADYCHASGLKLGIYSSPGPRTCGGYLASYQHELQDINTWVRWGIDYVKYDWCSYSQIAKDQSHAELVKPYALFRKQLDKVNRDIVYSMCQYGMGDVWEWGDSVGGNLWRTTGDITDTWNSMAGIGFGQSKSAPNAGPGHWNDPDMLVVGRVGWGPSLHASKLTADEQYTHISLWALMASPLLIGCDMTQLDDFTLNLLTNDEVLSVNQDPKGEQAIPIRQDKGIEIYLKHLSDGGLAIGIFNTGSTSLVESFVWDDQPTGKDIEVSWSDLGISGDYVVRDLWRQADMGTFTDSYTASVPYHGVILLKLIKE
ncbi:MAG: NPCBM/NEW2 domain-containing protein, partial [Bacteroidales bacterium]|nr:NPCBM/NEW2 domain-containing protein [Bacteroidales bacterium]